MLYIMQPQVKQLKKYPFINKNIEIEYEITEDKKFTDKNVIFLFCTRVGIVNTVFVEPINTVIAAKYT